MRVQLRIEIAARVVQEQRPREVPRETKRFRVFRFAAPLADQFYVMEHGRIVKQVEQRELAGNMAMLQEFLGV